MADTEHDLLLALATTPNFKKDKLIFVGRQSGLYRSSDAGKTWKKIQVVEGEELSVTALAITPNCLFAALTGGVAWSNDVGNSWSWTQLTAPAHYVSMLAVSPNFDKNNTLFAATLEDGVFRSVNRGVTWESWNFGLLDKQVLCLAANRESLFAGTGTGLFRSDNNARSWKEMSLPVEDSVLSLGLIGRSLFLGTESHGLFVSDDEGYSWKKIKVKVTEMPINAIQVSGKKVVSIRVLVGSKILESTNKGKTWRLIPLATTDNVLIFATPVVGFSSGEVATW